MLWHLLASEFFFPPFVLSLQITLFWDWMSCNLVDIYWLEEHAGTSSVKRLFPSTLKMETACSSGTSVTIDQTKWHHIPVESNLCNHCHENFKSHICSFFLSFPSPSLPLFVISLFLSLSFILASFMSLSCFFWVAPYTLF
jgi:hypothetical protein